MVYHKPHFFNGPSDRKIGYVWIKDTIAALVFDINQGPCAVNWNIVLKVLYRVITFMYRTLDLFCYHSCSDNVANEVISDRKKISFKSSSREVEKVINLCLRAREIDPKVWYKVKLFYCVTLCRGNKIVNLHACIAWD